MGYVLYQISSPIDESELNLDFTGDGDTDDYIPVVTHRFADTATVSEVLGQDILGGVLIQFLNGATQSVYAQKVNMDKRKNDTISLSGWGQHFERPKLASHPHFVNALFNVPLADNHLDSLLNGKPAYVSIAAVFDDTEPNTKIQGIADMAFKARLSIDAPSCWTLRLVDKA